MFGEKNAVFFKIFFHDIWHPTTCCAVILVIWSFVKIEIGLVKIRHYNINYLYIVSNDRVPEIDFDQNDIDQMTGFDPRK